MKSHLKDWMERAHHKHMLLTQAVYVCRLRSGDSVGQGQLGKRRSCLGMLLVIRPNPFGTLAFYEAVKQLNVTVHL